MYLINDLDMTHRKELGIYLPPLEQYLTSGPRVFICDRQGPITNLEAQQLIVTTYRAPKR